MARLKREQAVQAEERLADLTKQLAKVISALSGPESHGLESHGPESHGLESHGPESHGLESS